MRLPILTLAGALLFAGCNSRIYEPTAPTQAASTAKGPVQRGEERQEVQNDFHQLAIFYNQYDAENGHPPSLEDLKGYIQRDAPKLIQGLQDGRYILVPNAQPSSTAALVYEKDADLNGNRLVGRADGTVKLMNAQEFQVAIPKKEG
ncbi:MAG: hypothetical protein JO112_15760 [Planctomycetes bacterium]|nr:hypothetical protein [Planctomycetota bacterium]